MIAILLAIMLISDTHMLDILIVYYDILAQHTLLCYYIRLYYLISYHIVRAEAYDTIVSYMCVYTHIYSMYIYIYIYILCVYIYIYIHTCTYIGYSS